MSDLLPARRRRLEALLRTREDWIRVPGARSLSGDGELLRSANGSESEVERQERKAMERRYRERLLAEAEGREAGSLTGAEAAYRAHMASGSYRELDEALGQMKRRKPGSYWLLDRIYVQGLPVAVHSYQVDAAFQALSDLLPDLLHVPVMMLDPPAVEDRVERDRRIAAYHAAGRSTRWIASRVGVTQPRIVQILAAQRKLEEQRRMVA